MTPQYKTIVDTRKFNKITAVIIGVALSVPLLFVSFLFFQNVVTRASNSAPRDVVISNITQTSVKISWTTDQETQGVIEYGTTPTKLDFYAPEVQKTKDHSVEINLLTPKTGHYFQIRIGDQVFDNGGVPWTFTTRASLSNDETSATPSSVISRPVISPTLGVIPTATSIPTSCTETDCQKIRSKFGSGCSVADYIKCIQTSPAAGSSPTPMENKTPTVTSLGPNSKTNGSSDSEKNPAFSFMLSDPDSTATMKFQIQIDDSSDFSSRIIDYTSALSSGGLRGFTVGQATDGGTYAVGLTGQSLNVGSYYWRVRVIDSRGLTSQYTVANNGNIAFIVTP